MTKTLLLAATAVGAIAFAGSASAIDITSAQVSGTAAFDPSAASPTPYRLASQAVLGTSGLSTTTANTSVTSTLSANAGGLAAGTYIVRFEYTGIAGFTATPTLTTPNAAGCTVANTLSTGGGTAQNFVEFAVTVTGTCATNPSFVVAAPFKITALNNVSVKSSVSLNGVQLDNSASAPSRTIVSVVNGYTTLLSGAVDNANGEANPDNADYPTRLALGTGATPYTGFTAAGNPQAFDSVIGALGYTSNGTTYLELDGEGADLTSNAANQPAINVTINGAFQGLNVGLSTGDAAAVSVASTTNTGSQATFASVPAGRYNVVLTPVANNSTQLGGGNYNAAFATTGTNAKINGTIQVGQTGLETVLLEGTNFVAPWLQMQSQNYNAIVRISNIGGSATGPITLTLRANNGGTVNQTCQLTQAMLTSGTLVGGGIDQNKAIEFSGRTLANQCFGTTSTNADLQVTIQGTSTNLTAKVRIINPDSSVTESALGRLGELGVAF